MTKFEEEINKTVLYILNKGVKIKTKNYRETHNVNKNQKPKLIKHMLSLGVTKNQIKKEFKSYKYILEEIY